VLLGGKIKARKQVARISLLTTKAQLMDFERGLRAQAANSFVDGLAGQLIVRRQEKSLRRAQEFVAFNQNRKRSGKVAEIEVLRSRLSAL
jgi:outer membrane protein TolC